MGNDLMGMPTDSFESRRKWVLAARSRAEMVKRIAGMTQQERHWPDVWPFAWNVKTELWPSDAVKSASQDDLDYYGIDRSLDDDWDKYLAKRDGRNENNIWLCACETFWQDAVDGWWEGEWHTLLEGMNESWNQNARHRRRNYLDIVSAGRSDGWMVINNMGSWNLCGASRDEILDAMSDSYEWPFDELKRFYLVVCELSYLASLTSNYIIHETLYRRSEWEEVQQKKRADKIELDAGTVGPTGMMEVYHD